MTAKICEFKANKLPFSRLEEEVQKFRHFLRGHDLTVPNGWMPS